MTFTGTGGRITVEVMWAEGNWVMVRDPVTEYIYMAEPAELTDGQAIVPKQLELGDTASV